MKIQERCAHSNAAENVPNGSANLVSLQPFVKEWCSVSRYIHPADYPVDLLPPTVSSPGNTKTDISTTEQYTNTVIL